MSTYTVKSDDLKKFTLTCEETFLGELIYPNWYSFSASLNLNDDDEYELVSENFWDEKIELRKNKNVELEFKMGWQGIILTSKINGHDKNYLLKEVGLLKMKYVLIDTENNEILGIEAITKWNKFNSINYLLETSMEFESYANKEAFLLTLIHAINYQLSLQV